MQLSPPALALTAAVVWGGAILIIGTVGLIVPGYGDAVLSLVASIYPGYDNAGTFGDLMIGTVYAFFDGLVGGFVFALLYNAVARLTGRPAEPQSEPSVGAVMDADQARIEGNPSDSE